ncbi:adenosylcobinamide-phosphate synthase CbiB [Oceanirhabdus seepicola]|uniref:Cobalamin biosynthesis protein CobD n=1 Tax=Oceanirhabdus seepicola TaxID=2828781 RepID=A0A9J6P1C0_9CLOT|nr:adenosylcobinamide-phosphate synthase CbiB [Oceanirhabdus seepicola]MCM1990530.1 cobalamin biosynthesis protein [Oceanirhabdus seepicola]
MWYVIDVVIAVIIDWIVGDPYGFPHPIIYIGRLIRKLDKIFRKLAKNDKQLKMYGGVIVIVVALVTYLVPFLLLFITRKIGVLHHGLNIFILWTTLACKCLNVEGMKVYDALMKDDIEDARLKLSYIVGRETSQLSAEEIIRADVETVAENTADGVIAPLFYAMIGGAPLAMLYKGINTMDSTLGYLTEKYKHIGFFPAKVDDVFNIIPARLSGFLMALSAPVVGGNMVNGLKIMIRDRKNHKSPNCAYPEGATAGVLGIQLGGTNTYFGEKIYKPTIGDKVKTLSLEHIKDTVKLMYGSEIWLLAIYLLIIVIVYK